MVAIQESFDAFEYVKYLRSGWKFIVGCCVAAMALAAVASFALPRRYTATATILIDAPAGNDPRSATAVSQIYLESLKTYEQFAMSDSLFLRTVDRFKLREMMGSASVDTMKQRILRASKPRDTRLLEISVTLADAVKAQAVARFIAEETVEMNRTFTRQSDDEFAAAAKDQWEAARQKLEAADQARAAEASRASLEAMEAELRNLRTLEARLRGESVQARVDVAEYSAQQAAGGKSARGKVAERIRRDAAGARAREQELEKVIAPVEREIAKKQDALAKQRQRWEHVEAELAAARAAHESARRRLDEVRAAAGIRGERLKIIDPGIVPDRPSSPRTLLHILAALVIAGVASVLYLTMAFVSETRAKAQARPAEQ